VAIEPVFQIFQTELLGLFVALCLVGLVALVLVAVWMYRDARSRGIEPALWLVVLILATLIVGFLGLLVVLVVYLIVRGKHPVGGGMPVGVAPYPLAPYPTGAACPACGKGMLWIPQYGRWYCESCGQYR
jgi:hypothetical protein